jgi:hypothetical protein
MIFSTKLALLVTTFTILARAQNDPDGYPPCGSEGNIVNVRGPLRGAFTYLRSINKGAYWLDPRTDDVVVQSTPEAGQKWNYGFFNYRTNKLYVGVEWHASPNVVRHSVFTLSPGEDCHMNIGQPVTTVALYELT